MWVRVAVFGWNTWRCHL